MKIMEPTGIPYTPYPQGLIDMDVKRTPVTDVNGSPRESVNHDHYRRVIVARDEAEAARLQR